MLRMTKYPWFVAFAHVVASTWFCDTEWYWAPSTYHRSCCGDVERSHSSAYVWNPLWSDGENPDREPPMPVVSLHGPPGETPQCIVPHAVFAPLMFSMTSISPTCGQFV